MSLFSQMQAAGVAGLPAYGTGLVPGGGGMAYPPARMKPARGTHPVITHGDTLYIKGIPQHRVTIQTELSFNVLDPIRP